MNFHPHSAGHLPQHIRRRNDMRDYFNTIDRRARRQERRRRRQRIAFVISAAVVGAMILLVSGCAAPRVVLPETGAPVRAGPDLKGRVYVWTAAKTWELSGNAVQIPEGWYCWNPEGTNNLTKGK